MHEDEACVLKISRAGAIGTEVLRFEGETFESVLRQAADAGALKSVCLEKQIAFMARALPPSAGDRSTPPDDHESPRDPVAIAALFPDMTATISALVHETQRERGASSLYLSSNGRRFAEELHAQWHITDQRRAALVSFRRRHEGTLPLVLARQWDRSELLLAELVSGRRAVEALNLAPSQVIERYSRANGELLSMIDTLAQNGFPYGLESGRRASAVAWMALLHAKEKTGIERAQLASAFTWDRYGEGQHATVSALIAASDSYLHMFSTAAPRRAGELLRQQLRSEVATAVSQMERVALLRADGGFGIDPTAWFANVSRKMDMLAAVESVVRATLPSSR